MLTKGRVVCSVVIIFAIGLLGFFSFFPAYIDKQTNAVHASTLPQVSEQAKALHKTLMIGDWHSDSLLWKRQLGQQHNYAHMDLPRLRQGNVAMQMLTTVTKSPSGINYQENSSEAADNITKLAISNLWPINTWQNLTQRALFQAQKVQQLVTEYPQDAVLVSSKSELAAFLQQRQHNPDLVALLLGTEGSHALEGQLSNIQLLYQHGFRMMSLQHFFDNQLGGSLHGESGQGLTQFGRDAVLTMQALDIMVDVSHSSKQVVKDVLAISTKPLLVSHTGFYGHCPSARNISDNLMQQIAAQGGLIAVGYWDGAVCEANVQEIAKAIFYGVQLLGSQHIALGSDFDGATSVPFDTSELVYLTQALLDIGLSSEQIRQVMGENMLNFLQQHLPD
ncbi:dipeptidase [Paraglaciecola aestuariivivens]